MKKNRPGRFFVKAEQIQLPAQLSVITFFSLFQISNVFIQFFLGGKGSAVNSLKHFILLAPAPVSARNAEEFDCFDFAGFLHMRTAAKIDEFTVFVNGYLAVRYSLNDFTFIVFTTLTEKINRRGLIHFIPFKSVSRLYDFIHQRFDLHQVFFRKISFHLKVVVKTVFDGGPYSQLGVREKSLHRLRENMRGAVPQTVQITVDKIFFFGVSHRIQRCPFLKYKTWAIEDSNL